MTSILLLWPPTVNHYYCKSGKRTYISKRGEDYRLHVRHTWAKSGFRGSRAGEKLGVWVKCHPPDKRIRDLGNLDKSLMDALTHAGAWADDFDIDDLRFTRVWDGQPPGSVLVTITPIASSLEAEVGPHGLSLEPSSSA